MYFLNKNVFSCSLLSLIFTMIDYFISDQKNIFGLKRSYTCKVMNFLILRDFFEIFQKKFEKKRKFDHRTSTIHVTPHTRIVQHRSLSRASSTFHIPHMPIYPTISQFGYPTPPMVPDRRLDLGMNKSHYPYIPHGYHDYLLITCYLYMNLHDY